MFQFRFELKIYFLVIIEEDSLDTQLTDGDSCEISDEKIHNGVTKRSSDFKNGNPKTNGILSKF